MNLFRLFLKGGTSNINVIFPSDWQAFVNFQSYIANDNYDKYSVDIGFRTTF